MQKRFCDTCWADGTRTQNDNLPVIATFAVQTPAGSNKDSCDNHLLPTIMESFNNTRHMNNDNEIIVKRL